VALRYRESTVPSPRYRESTVPEPPDIGRAQLRWSKRGLDYSIRPLKSPEPMLKPLKSDLNVVFMGVLCSHISTEKHY